MITHRQSKLRRLASRRDSLSRVDDVGAELLSENNTLLRKSKDQDPGCPLLTARKEELLLQLSSVLLEERDELKPGRKLGDHQEEKKL